MLFGVCVCVFRYFSLFRQHLSCVVFFFCYHSFRATETPLHWYRWEQMQSSVTTFCLSLVENWKCRGGTCILYCHYWLSTSSSMYRGLGSCVRGCVKLIKEFLYSNPYIGNTPSLTNVSGEARCKTGSKQDLGATILLSKRDWFLSCDWNYYQDAEVCIPQQKSIISKYKHLLLMPMNSSHSYI